MTMRPDSICMSSRARIVLLLACAAILADSCVEREFPKTVFQTSQEWRPTMDNRADAAIVYGIESQGHLGRKRPFAERLSSWQHHGYTTFFMSGMAWGEYQDYFSGEWDGSTHFDEGQVNAQGDTLWHGPSVPYIVPTENYLAYIKERHIKAAIDAGVDVVFMEEPEFWNEGGYSEAFKCEWEDYYGFPWRPQHESPENTYLANKLKYHLYYRALDEVFTFANEYGRSLGRDIKCFVPTHSLVNYSMWQIVSPEASLASLPSVDGYIAQVWTGTSRTPNYFEGVMRERVFETAFLEYGAMESMTVPTGRKMYFLTDPVEDRPRDWDDFARNYEATFTAQLLYPGIADYEVMPWPERIYEGQYRVSADSEETAGIPESFSTQMQVMVCSLNRMPQSDNSLGGSEGIAVLMSNSLMFQRFPLHEGYDDPQLSDFFGLALPLLKKGVPVKTVHMENLGYRGSLKDVKLLLMTYSNMKPLDPKAHEYISEWVKEGGLLLFCGRDDDPFQKVAEWWTERGYEAPSAHLFALLGLPENPEGGIYECERGRVGIIRQDPKEFVMSAGSAEGLAEVIGELYGKISVKNHFTLIRSPYEIIAVMDESVSDEPYVAEGLYIDLFDPSLPIVKRKGVLPGECGYLFDLSKVKGKRPQILASSGREYNEKRNGHSYSFTLLGPVGTKGISRILLPSEPTSVLVDGEESFNKDSWDDESRTYLLSHPNSSDGVSVMIRW